MDDIKQGDYQVLAAAWRALRRTTGIRVREVACVGVARTLLLAELGDSRLPLVTIAAGVHGDEPAGPSALYGIVRDGLLDRRFAYRLWPCVNPSGFAAGTRTNAEGIDVNRSFGRGGRSPEARAILTANRDRRFVLAIDLHEDHEADGFYLYETASAGQPSRYAAAVTEALREAGLPLQRFGADFELGPPGSETAQRRELGAVIVDADAETPFFAGALPVGLVLVRRAAPYALTFESPRCARPDERLAAHRLAVVSALQTALATLP